MNIFVRLVEEFLKSVPTWAKALVALELGTYFFFAYFFFPTRAAETFRSVLLDFRWQVTALAEASITVAAVLLFSAKRALVSRGRPAAAAMVLGSLLLVAAPLAVYSAVRPWPLAPMRVDIFLLDAAGRVRGVEEHVLRDLLRQSGDRLRITFNWPDWSQAAPAGIDTLTPLDRLSALARRFGSPHPIGITSAPLDQDLFWLSLVGSAGRLAVISTADWAERFAPPSTEEYLLHAVVLNTLIYRLNAAGEKVTEHRPEDFGVFYFDAVVRKSQMKEVICNGRFKPEDEQVVRRALGGSALDAYRDVLSLPSLARRTCPR